MASDSLKGKTVHVAGSPGFTCIHLVEALVEAIEVRVLDGLAEPVLAVV